MLTLTRKTGESILFVVPLEGGYAVEIALMVTEIDRGQVKLGLVAPRDVVITRDELLKGPSPALLDLKASYDRRCAGRR